jgi:aspartate racemase
MNLTTRPIRTPLIGILGGMGPAATVDFYAKLVDATPARYDQDHLRVVIWADPTTPDRSRALLDHGADPTPWLVQGVRALTTAGADVITIPCNTAHAFLGPITQEAGDVPVLNLIHHACQRTRQLDPPVRAVGLLATTGTVRAGLYHDPLAQAGMTVMAPDDRTQLHEVMPAIAEMKAGKAASGTLCRLAAELADRGAHAIIAGCTEVALALRDNQLGVPVIDPAQILAEAAVAWAYGRSTGHTRDNPRENHVVRTAAACA